MTKKEIIQSLLQQAQNDKQTADDLFTLKHYDWCLFLWHLTIEKTLKAKLLSEKKEIIYIHDLSRLYKKSGLITSKTILDQLDEITTFHIEARYDSIKQAFYKKATKIYATKWVTICNKLYNLILESI